MNGYHPADAEDDSSLTDHLKAVSTETRELASMLREIVIDAESAARKNLTERPYATLAMAVGVGYVLGGGLPTRLTALLVSMGTRFAFQAAAQQFLTQSTKGKERQ